MLQGEWQQITDKIRRKVMPPGKQLMIMLVEFKQGGFGTEHAHPHEQIGFVVSGRIKMMLGGDEVVVEAGEQIVVPGNVLHAVWALEDTTLLEIFTPLREDLLATITINEKTEMSS
ncbi:cupin domain-containing protein [Paenibacillus paridis]|uniref:cupin domain-containing protein n=1 Tax=Paenibacillus paridis TaxID=2583376 RepID=UPI0011236B99|nr:cupin domain-containing protein [Paenibacillus paridis]